MMKNSLKTTIESVGLSYKKEITKIILTNVIFVMAMMATYIFIKNILLVIGIFIGLALLDFFLLTSYSDKKRLLIANRENELITIISYFEVYIENSNNVYHSFAQLMPFCSAWMKDKIEILLKEIDNDKSVQPFVNFSKNFSQLSSQSLMISIYQMVDQGENSNQLQQFKMIFDELTKNRNKDAMEKHEKALSNMSSFPLIGAGLITITLTISILSILGDLINVI